MTDSKKNKKLPVFYEKILGKYTSNWAVADLTWLELNRGNKADNTRPCAGEGGGQ